MTTYAGTKVYAPLTTGSALDRFPTHQANLGEGGVHNVANITERDAIPSERLLDGMFVYVVDYDGAGHPRTYQRVSGAWVVSGSEFDPLGAADAAVADHEGDFTHSDIALNTAARHVAVTISGNGLALAGQQLSLTIGTGATQVAAGNHGHAGVYSPVAHDHAGVYSPVNHNHDLTYSALAHVHDDLYSVLAHTHDGVYSPVSHNHATTYAPLSHNHSGVYSPVNHDHTGVYSPAAHNHDAAYSAITHNHDLEYADIDHLHTGVYSPVAHNHSGVYAAENHNHSGVYSPVAHDHAGVYSPTNHNHDLVYAAIGHNHDTVYAGITHNHTGVYSVVGHNHDAAYAALSHDHTGTYSAVDHLHTGVYSAADHLHTGTYSPVAHNHTGVYSTVDHDHDLTYAGIVHTHTGTYSPVGHTHTEYSLTTHNHTGVYSLIDHNHDLAYAAIGHNHDGVYSTTTHNHDTIYAAIVHNHDESYATLTHNHDSAYAAIGHNHNSTYALIGHNHDSAYSAVGHVHAWNMIDHPQSNQALTMGATTSTWSYTNGMVFKFTNVGMAIGSASSTTSAKLEITSAGSEICFAGMTTKGGVWSDGTSTLYLADWATGTKGIRVFVSTGMVAINQASPFATFHATDASNANNGTIAVGHYNYPALITATASDGKMSIDNRGSSASGHISFYPNGQSTSQSTEMMRISKDGVGINCDPGASLQIVGKANWWSGRIDASTTTDESYGLYVIAGTTIDDQALHVRNAANSASFLSVNGVGDVGIGCGNADTYLPGTDGLAIYAADYPSIILANPYRRWGFWLHSSVETLFLWNNSGIGNAMAFFPDGNVAIGTDTNNGYKLDVNGKVRAVGFDSAEFDEETANLTAQTGFHFTYGGMVWSLGASIKSDAEVGDFCLANVIAIRVA
jgi:hypothetical protein